MYDQKVHGILGVNFNPINGNALLVLTRHIMELCLKTLKIYCRMSQLQC